MKTHLTRTFGNWETTHVRFDFDWNEVPRLQLRGGREGDYAWVNIAIGSRYGDDLISAEFGVRRPRGRRVRPDRAPQPSERRSGHQQTA